MFKRRIFSISTQRVPFEHHSFRYQIIELLDLEVLDLVNSTKESDISLKMLPTRLTKAPSNGICSQPNRRNRLLANNFGNYRRQRLLAGRLRNPPGQRHLIIFGNSANSQIFRMLWLLMEERKTLFGGWSCLYILFDILFFNRIVPTAIFCDFKAIIGYILNNGPSFFLGT